MDVLLIEDDAAIGKAVQQGLREAGHECLLVKEGKKGLEALRSQKHEVVLLDLMLPGQSGLNLLKTAREEGIRTPVIILTARGSTEDKVSGFKKGADDYVVKPVAIPELVARIEAVSRRSMTKPSPVVEVGNIHLDLASRRVTVDGSSVDLTPTEFSILELLMRHAGQVVTRKMLCEALWDSDWEGTTNVIEVHINRLRTKLQKTGKDVPIQTVRGRGYALPA